MYRADVRDPEYLECMAMVNSLCSWQAEALLLAFHGHGPRQPPKLPNLYVYLFRVNQAWDRWTRLERVVRNLMITDAIFRTS